VTFIRNPVDRVISNYKFFKKRILTGEASKNHSINESLLKYAHRSGCKNKMSKMMDGSSKKDLYYIGRFESFEEDVRELFYKLNLKVDIIPKSNVNKVIPSSDIVCTPFHRAVIAMQNYRDLILYQKTMWLKRVNLSN
jgi:hypothetical protein